MPSPFPGMDPYLESPETWPDFHGTFLMSIRAALNQSLPSPYVARWDRYVWIDEPETEQARPLGRPDVYVADRLGQEEGTGLKTALAAPATVTLPAVDPKGKPFLKIIDTRGHRVVSVIELLSPANKAAGRDRDAYLAKREEYFRAGTNVVEMDLLRSGLRAPMEPQPAPADYYILVSPAADYPKAGVWPLTVRDPLPPVPIPLKPQDPPVMLDLRPCLDRTYDEARFQDEIDYDEPPTPPLGEPDAAWARELLAQRQR
jgi:hypothetical protein